MQQIAEICGRLVSRGDGEEHRTSLEDGRLAGIDPAQPAWYESRKAIFSEIPVLSLFRFTQNR